MATILQDYRAILRQELKLRRKFNSRYSLRAFARHLGLLPHRLSAVLNGKFGLSPDAARRLAARLGYTEQQAAYFCGLVESEHARSGAARAAALERVRLLQDVELWPRRPPPLAIRDAVEIGLWGLADPGAVTRFLAPHGAAPFLSAEFGGAARIGLSMRRGFDDDPGQHHEFSVVVLVADIQSNTGYGIFVLNHLTDSVSIVRSRQRHFEKAPRLTGRIELDFPGDKAGGSVDDHEGNLLYEIRVARPGKAGREAKLPLSLVRNVRLPGGRVGKTRVVGLSSYRDRKFDPARDTFVVRPGSKLAVFLKSVHFRPVSWRFYRSKYDYFPS